jgi:hypothetical protein
MSVLQWRLTRSLRKTLTVRLRSGVDPTLGKQGAPVLMEMGTVNGDGDTAGAVISASCLAKELRALMAEVHMVDLLPGELAALVDILGGVLLRKAAGTEEPLRPTLCTPL